MKYTITTILTMALLMLIGWQAQAQNIIQISEGENQIDEAIFAAEPGDIIELTTNGGYYYELFAATIDKPLTIRAAEGLTHKPIWVSDDGAIIYPKADLRLEGIMFAGVMKTDTSSRAIRIDGADNIGMNLFIDNVDFFGFSGEAIRAYPEAQADTVMITNSRFFDIGGRALRFRDDPINQPGSVKTLIVEHSTFWNVDGEIVYVDDPDDFLATPGPEFRFVNNTIHNVANNRPLYPSYTDDVHILNNIITNEQEGNIAAQIYGENTVVDYLMTFNTPNGFELRQDASVDGRTIYSETDPLYADPFSGNLRLTNSSPAIGAGQDGITLGDQRWWNDTPGKMVIDGYMDDWATLEPIYEVEENDPAIEDFLEMRRVWIAVDDEKMVFRMDFFADANIDPGFEEPGIYNPWQRWHRVVFQDIDGGDKYDYRMSSYPGTVNEVSFTRARHRLRSTELAYTNNEYDGERMKGQIAWSKDGMSMEAFIMLDSLYVTDGVTTYQVTKDDSLQIRYHIEAGDPRNFLPGLDGDRTQQGDFFRILLSDYYVGDPVAEPVNPLIPTNLESEPFSGLPGEYKLDQNFPNPFNPTTNIRFSLPEASDVTLEVFNVLGQRVAVLTNQQLQSGTHTAEFDASALSSGVYLYRLSTEQFVETRKMLLVK
jgi:hypothetical protein